jgi:hypothetical protein
VKSRCSTSQRRIISLAVAMGLLLVGSAGIFSRMDPTYHDSMIFGTLLAFLSFVPIIAIGSYIGLKVFLLNHDADLCTNNDEESSQVIISRPPPTENRTLPVTISQTPTAVSAASPSQQGGPQSTGAKEPRQSGDNNLKKPGKRETGLLISSLQTVVRKANHLTG